MLLYAAIGVATLIACEIALRLPLADTLTTLTRTPRRIAAVIGSPRISDTWKQKVLPAYAGKLFTASVTLLLYVLAIAAPVVLAAYLLTGSLADGAARLVEAAPLGLMLVTGAAYVFIRKRVTHE